MLYFLSLAAILSLFSILYALFDTFRDSALLVAQILDFALIDSLFSW